MASTMNKSQLVLAIESIEGDCDIRFSLKNDDGYTCALGGLAESAGFDAGMHNQRFTEILHEVGKFYGLTTIQTHKIVGLNDKYAKKVTRVKHIVKYLNSLELE